MSAGDIENEADVVQKLKRPDPAATWSGARAASAMLLSGAKRNPMPKPCTAPIMLTCVKSISVSKRAR